MTEPQPSYAPEEEPSPRRSGGRGWSIAGIICGVVSFLLVPILFGILGIVFGIVGYRRGDRGLGTVAIIISTAGLVIWVILVIVAILAPPPAT